MKTIYKYQIPLGQQDCVVTMPDGASVLSVGVQDNAAVLWAVVTPAAPPRAYRCRVVTTGGVMPDNMFASGSRLRFVGTFQIGVGVGAFVGHLFVETNK